jgi:acetate kinase
MNLNAKNRPRPGSLIMPILLTLNAGSSSMKFAVFSPEAGELVALCHGLIEGLGASAVFSVRTPDGGRAQHALDPAQAPHDHHRAMDEVLGWLGRVHPGREVVAVSHRVVHGGPDLIDPLIVDGDALRRLRTFVPLAPLHQPHNLAGIAAARTAFPAALQIACFDTAFHRNQPFVSDTFALPRRFHDEGIRRYGFHGLSYEFIARALKSSHPALSAGRVVVAHLGNGASMCAMRSGVSVASTMGFSTLDGLPMGTRCGQIDPGVLLYLLTEKGWSTQQLAELLYKDAGLKGMSGLSNDVRELQASDSSAAGEALDYFIARCRREVGSLAAAMDGLDALVLTGGIGENAVELRARLLTGLGWLGIEFDEAANRAGGPLISRAGSPVAVLVLKTDEERMLALHAAELMAGVAAKPGDASPTPP